MEINLADNASTPDNVEFRQLCAQYLDPSSLTLATSLTQESITLLRDKVLDGSALHTSGARIFAIIDNWNAAQVISKLSPEIISHIVAVGFPITEQFGERDQSLSGQYMKMLASLSMVVRVWRNAIVGTPSLWGLLCTSVPPHINRLSVERSRNCPLVIKITPSVLEPPTEPDDILDIALPHWNRWSQARIECPSLDRLLDYLSSAAPILETFHFWVDYEAMADSERVPINLFGGYAPRLQDVLLDGEAIAWDSEVLRGLRKLCLQSIFNQLISVDQFLAFLAASPSLESLTIHNVATESPPLPSPSARPPIQLPHLKEIKLDGIDIEVVGDILPFIRAPKCERLNVRIENSGNTFYFDFADFLDRSLGHFETFFRSTVTSHGSSTLRLKFDDEGGEWSCEPSGLATPSFYLSIPAIKRDTLVSWISGFLRPELGPVHRLGLDLSRNWLIIPDPDVSWLNALARLPNVFKINMRDVGELAQDILGLLGTWSDGSMGTRSPSFPDLKVLHLARIHEWTLSDLETMLACRYGDSGKGGSKPPEISIILARQFSPRLRRLDNVRVPFEELCRIRTTQGVESVKLEKLIRPRGFEGMLAFVYDDASGSCRDPFGY